MNRKPVYALAATIVSVLGLSAAVTAHAAAGTTPSVVDYAQCANGAPPSTSKACPASWINGILQASNSHYSEDDVVPQRAEVSVPAAGTGTEHSLTFRYLARKDSANAHAYDSLSTWNYTQTAADRCANLPSKAVCPSGSASTYPIPADTTAVYPVGAGVSPDTSTHSIPGVMTMYGGTLTGVSTPVHDHPNAGTGDDYATIVVKFTTTKSAAAQSVQLLFGGHLAAGLGPRGWGAGLGAAAISGGPYHIKWDGIDGASAGGRDNQIQAGAIVPLSPAFTIAKTSDAPAGGVAPGATVKYTVTVHNGGQGSGTFTFHDVYQVGVTIDDTTLPTGCTDDVPTRTITCTATLAADASQVFTYSAKMPSTFPDDTFKGLDPCTSTTTTQYRVRNTATLSVTGSTPATADVCVNAAPHFVATKSNDAPKPTSSSPGGVAPGATVNYTVTITNNGSAPGSTTFTDKYQTGVTILSVPGGCTDDGAGTLSCTTSTISPVAPGNTQVFTYAAKMPTSFPDNTSKGQGSCNSTQYLVVNTVTVNGTPKTSDVCVNAAPHFVPAKSVSPATTIPGGTVTYKLTVRNDGTAPGVGTVTDVRQAGVIIVGSLPQGCTDDTPTLTITCTTGTTLLAPGGQMSWQYQAKMPTTFSGSTGGGQCSSTQYKITNSATAGTTTVTADECVDVSPSFVISKSNDSDTANGVAPGATVHYTVTVTNNGTLAGSTTFTDVYQTGVVVDDTSFSPKTCTDNTATRTITCTTATIAANGGSQTFKYTATMPTSFSDLTGQNAAPCTGGRFLVKNTATLSGNTSGTTSPVCVNAAPKFTSTKTASPTVVNPGDTVTYTVKITNSGTAPGKETFSDTPTTGVQILTYPSSCTLTAGTLTCTTDLLAPTGSQSFIYTAKMPTSSTGTLGGAPCSNTQLKIVNNAVLTTGTGSSSTVCVNEPVLTLNKSACTSNPIPVNGQLSYTLTYANTGSAPATNTVLKDTIPAGTNVADAGGGTVTTSGTATTVTWTIGTVAAGGSGSRTLTIGVDPTNTGGQLVNSATIRSTETSATSNTVNNTVSNQGASASGRAYGVYANVLNVLPVGPIPDATDNQSTSLATLSTSVLSLGLLNASNSHSVTPTQATDTAVASVADVGVNLLGVGVHAAAVVARSQSNASGSTATSTTNGSEVLGLTINGTSYGDISSPRVITVVNLLGIQVAEVDVLQQVDASGAALGGAAGAQPQSGFFNSGIGVNGLRVRLLNGAADVIVSHAESKAQFPTGTPCSNSAPYVIGSAVIANEQLTYPTGPTTAQVNPITLPSTGGDVSSTINTLSLLPLAGSATGADSSHGTLSPRAADSVADVEGASLLGAAITATTIKSTAAATTTTLSGTCTIVNLRIGGIVVNVLANPAPNTVLLDITRTLLLVVNEQIVGSGHVITVNAIHLYVLGAGNPLGLPVGSDLVISGSTAGTS